MDARVYSDLRRAALGVMGGLPDGVILTPSVLVHEAWLKLDEGGAKWNGMEHFKASAALAMRQIVADHARAARALKHGGAYRRVTVSSSLFETEEHEFDFEALDLSLDRLAEKDPRAARVVVMRFFGGLTNPEVAQQLDLSLRAVEADWTHARAWLRREMEKHVGNDR